jgi:hypothetical protein
MEVGFLDAFAMVALRIREAKQTLFQEGTAFNVSVAFQAMSRLHEGVVAALFFVPKGKGDILQAMRV